MEHIDGIFFVLCNALISIGNGNGFFDNAVGEMGKLNFNIKLIEGLFGCRIALIRVSVGFDNELFLNVVVGKFGISARGNKPS